MCLICIKVTCGIWRWGPLWEGFETWLSTDRGEMPDFRAANNPGEKSSNQVTSRYRVFLKCPKWGPGRTSWKSMFNLPCQLWFFVGSWIHPRPEHCPLGHQALQHIVLKVQFQNSVWSLFDDFIKWQISHFLVYSPNTDFGLKIIDFGLARRLNEDGHTDVKELQVVKFASLYPSKIL